MNNRRLSQHHFHGLRFKKSGKVIVEQAASLASRLEAHLVTREKRVRDFLDTKLKGVMNADKFIELLRNGDAENTIGSIGSSYSNSLNVAASEMDGFRAELENYNGDRESVQSLKLITRNLVADEQLYELNQDDLQLLEF